MTEVEQRTEEIAGEPVSWRAAPAEGTLPLYLHGVPNGAVVWQRFLERTGGLALDLPGFGASVKASTFPYSIAGFAGFVERFLDWLEIDRVSLVMHDFGAAGLAFAQRAPGRIERIVLINPLPLFEGYPWHRLARVWRTPVLGELWMGSLTRRLLARTLRNANASPLPADELAQIYAGMDFGTQRAILKLYRSVRPGTLAAAGAALHELDAPALIVWGELDPYIPARVVADYAAALGGECETLVLEDAGHWPWLDRAEVIETVAEFLARG